MAQLVGPRRGATDAGTAAQFKALADASQRADELLLKKTNDAQDEGDAHVDLLAESDLSLSPETRKNEQKHKLQFIGKASHRLERSVRWSARSRRDSRMQHATATVLATVLCVRMRTLRTHI
jgi:hypothetical protein